MLVDNGSRFGVIYILSIYLDLEKWEGTRCWDKCYVDTLIIPKDKNSICSLPSYTLLFMSIYKINSVLSIIAEVKNIDKSSQNASLGQVDLLIFLKYPRCWL